MSGQERYQGRDESTEESVNTSSPKKGPDWVALARSSYNGSTDWIDANRRKRWGNNERAFRNQHHTGSKYLSSQYKHRSKIYRPKTRSALRSQEAAAAAAFFATNDVVGVAPQNEETPWARMVAEISQECLNYRLTKKGEGGIPWFLTCMGAFQDANKNGICFSKQWWEYEEEKDGTEIVVEQGVDEFGYPMETETEQPKIKVIHDRPRSDLRPIENIRFDPAADWLDPINTSPYLIDMVPMFAGDVKARMKRNDPKTGLPEWKEVDDKTLSKAKNIDYDSVRNARDGTWEAKARETGVEDHEIVWIHENFVRVEGKEWVYFTVGIFELLSDPMPLEEAYWHGERPYTFGYSVLETHKAYPSGKIELTEPVQREINDIANLRLDGVKFSITPIQKVRRGKKLDVNALTNLSPGKPIYMDDPESDLVTDRAGPNIAGAGYQEEDRANLSFDDLSGNFSGSSIQSNRQLNETVGGMQLLSGNAGSLGEYDLRVFAETWVEATLSQLMKLEQAYETDATIVALAGEKAGVFEKYNFDPRENAEALLEGLWKEELAVTVNVGIGATDPSQQLQKFVYGMNSLAQISAPIIQMQGPQFLQSPAFKEIAGEIFGKLGYKDSDRFFDFGDQGQDPMVMQMQQQMQQMQQALEQAQGELQSRSQEKQFDAQVKMALGGQKMEIEGAKGQMQMAQDQRNFQMDNVKANRDFQMDMKRAQVSQSNTNVM